MVKSLRAHPLGNVIVWDVLNAADISIRSQPFPIVLRDRFNFVFSCGSLTGLLRAQYKNVRVQCLSVRQDIHSKALYRDVEVLANEQCYWRARTMIPISTKHYLSRYFQIYENFSIGDFLFCSHRVRRKSLTLSIQFHCPVSMSETRKWYWVRHSVWVIHDVYELHVAEYF